MNGAMTCIASQPHTQEVESPMLRQYTRQYTAAQRFWTKVEFTDSCWLWTAQRDQAGGYGVFWCERPVMAHRWAYEFCVGEIPAGLTLDHLCRVRHCVRPAHLEPVTGRVNILRGVGPTAINARKTHCTHGHALAGTNLRREGARRQCRECGRLRQARHRNKVLDEVLKEIAR